MAKMIEVITLMSSDEETIPEVDTIETKTGKTTVKIEINEDLKRDNKYFTSNSIKSSLSSFNSNHCSNSDSNLNLKNASSKLKNKKSSCMNLKKTARKSLNLPSSQNCLETNTRKDILLDKKASCDNIKLSNKSEKANHKINTSVLKSCSTEKKDEEEMDIGSENVISCIKKLVERGIISTSIPSNSKDNFKRASSQDKSSHLNINNSLLNQKVPVNNTPFNHNEKKFKDSSEKFLSEKSACYKKRKKEDKAVSDIFLTDTSKKRKLGNDNEEMSFNRENKPSFSSDIEVKVIKDSIPTDISKKIKLDNKGVDTLNRENKSSVSNIVNEADIPANLVSLDEVASTSSTDLSKFDSFEKPLVKDLCCESVEMNKHEVKNSISENCLSDTMSAHLNTGTIAEAKLLNKDNVAFHKHFKSSNTSNKIKNEIKSNISSDGIGLLDMRSIHKESSQVESLLLDNPDLLLIPTNTKEGENVKSKNVQVSFSNIVNSNNSLEDLKNSNIKEIQCSNSLDNVFKLQSTNDMPVKLVDLNEKNSEDSEKEEGDIEIKDFKCKNIPVLEKDTRIHFNQSVQLNPSCSKVAEMAVEQKSEPDIKEPNSEDSEKEEGDIEMKSFKCKNIPVLEEDTRIHSNQSVQLNPSCSKVEETTVEQKSEPDIKETNSEDSEKEEGDIEIKDIRCKNISVLEEDTRIHSNQSVPLNPSCSKVEEMAVEQKSEPDIKEPNYLKSGSESVQLNSSSSKVEKITEEQRKPNKEVTSPKLSLKRKREENPNGVLDSCGKHLKFMSDHIKTLSDPKKSSLEIKNSETEESLKSNRANVNTHNLEIQQEAQTMSSLLNDANNLLPGPSNRTDFAESNKQKFNLLIEFCVSQKVFNIEESRKAQEKMNRSLERVDDSYLNSLEFSNCIDTVYEKVKSNSSVCMELLNLRKELKSHEKYKESISRDMDPSSLDTNINFEKNEFLKNSLQLIEKSENKVVNMRTDTSMQEIYSEEDSLSQTGNQEACSSTAKKEILSKFKVNSDSNLVKNEMNALNEIAKKKIDKKIAELEKYLKKLDKTIQKLQTKELTLDEMDDDHSAYILEEKYKNKFMKTWKLLCKLHQQSAHVNEVEKKFRYNGSRFPEINKGIEKFINKQKVSKQFPSYDEIYKIIKDVNETVQLGLRESYCESLAKDTFRDVGEKLKRRRGRDLKHNLLCFETENSRLVDDPAENDENLRRVLDTNAREGEKKLNDVIEKYVIEQESSNRKEGKVEECSEDEESDASVETEYREVDSNLPDTEPSSPASDKHFPLNNRTDVTVIDIGTDSNASTDPGFKDVNHEEQFRNVSELVPTAFHFKSELTDSDTSSDLPSL